MKQQNWPIIAIHVIKVQYSAISLPAGTRFVRFLIKKGYLLVLQPTFKPKKSMSANI